MPGLAAFRSHLGTLLAEQAGSLRLPGAVCGVLLDGETVIATHGLANVATGVEVTADTLFQIGSLSKLYTTTLVLQAHSAGVLALDEPVRSQLQEFSVGDPGATLEITPRHLLTHTSGIAGDHLLDTGANDDALQRYVATLAALGQAHAPDESYSFCNTGFGVLGRMIEVCTGGTFDRSLRRRLTRPLGCTTTLMLPQHLLLRRVAVGHVQRPGEEPTRQPRWTLTRANGPMGGIVATAEDVLTFARMHLESGVAVDGTEIVPPAAVELMAEPHLDTPIPGERQALGWTVWQWGDATCLGQDADTFGQRAFLRVVPSRGFALVLLTNSPLGATLARGLVPRVAADLLDLDATPALAGPGTSGAAGAAAADPGAPLPDAERFAGTYARLHQRIVVAADPEGPTLTATIEPSGVLAKLGSRHAEVRLRPLDPERGVFALTDPATGVDELAVFDRGDGTDPCRTLHLDGRLHRRWT
ncbi:MAG TPA: serine hydrolase domain-containing protein [Acidimicrobiales bacterium]